MWSIYLTELMWLDAMIKWKKERKKNSFILFIISFGFIPISGFIHAGRQGFCLIATCLISCVGFEFRQNMHCSVFCIRNSIQGGDEGGLLLVNLNKFLVYFV
uniref:Uncharacterized protein n=1 Tax=Cacopsylla melanoneura TaxID=428564 RepID=A0A8D8LQR1_9HEMI